MCWSHYVLIFYRLYWQTPKRSWSVHEQFVWPSKSCSQVCWKYDVYKDRKWWAWLLNRESIILYFHVKYKALELKVWSSLLMKLSVRLSDCLSLKLVTRIWSKIEITTFTWYVWIFSLPACWIMYGYYREKLHVNHFQELKG